MATQTFNSGSGTWTVPSGKVLTTIELWGGGAGGGAGDGAHSGGASGGGSGAYVLKNQTAGAGTEINYSVGAGGAGNTIADDGSPGSPGGATTVSTYSLSAGGGQVGADWQASGAGGTASGGDTNTNGNASSANSSSSGGNGASAPNGGTGGTGGGSSSPDATAGTAPGAGGGGGGRHTTGGAGAAGRIVFTYSDAPPTERLLEIEAWQTLLSGEAGYSSQALVNRHFGYNDTQYTIQQAMYLNNAGSQGKSVQQMIYENIKTGASLTDPFTRYTVQDLLNAAISASVSAETVLGA